MRTPKVSIIMPSLNVAPFIRECIESAVQQTLADIEILCVDAGSTDGTVEILQEYADLDSRVHLIHSDKKSYGYQMNLGLDAATGDYIGILETDDWVEADMFETLWKTAQTHDVDVVKSNYFWYTTKQGIHNEPFENLKKCHYDTVFSPMENRELFNVTPSIWSAIYRREMLKEQGIRFNETPGASFQDTSFHFMVCSVAKRCYLLKEHYLHYRRDNDGSSVHSASKVFCIADEMHYYEAFLASKPECRQALEGFYQALKYEKYRWNYARLGMEHQYSFLKLMHREFSQAKQDGLLLQKNFTYSAWNAVNTVIDNPIAYFRNSTAQLADKLGYLPSPEPKIIKYASCDNPLISVIIPVFNSEKYLEECINSVLQQSMTQIEIICINDGSMDHSLEMLMKYAEEDSRICIVDQINAGQSRARNVGFQLARGKYLYFMDSDDYILPGTFDTLYSRADQSQTDILYFGAESFFEDKELKQNHENYVNFYRRTISFDEPVSGDMLLMDQLEKWLFRCSLPLQLIRREFLVETGIRFKEGIIHEDELFSCLLAAKAKRSLCITDSLYMRRVRANSTMTAVYTANKFVGFFVVSTTLMSNAIIDNSLSKIGKEALLFHANKILGDAKNTYRNLSDTDREEILTLLPFEFRPYYYEMVAAFQGNYKELLAIKWSTSYKVGRFITFVPRKIKSTVKCLRDHGFRYTIEHAFQKITKPFVLIVRKGPATVRSSVQYIQEHGVMYTLKHGLKKLLHR